MDSVSSAWRHRLQTREAGELAAEQVRQHCRVAAEVLASMAPVVTLPKGKAVPMTASLKEAIQAWLMSKGIPWDPRMAKKQFLNNVASVEQQFLKYCVYATADRACTVVRLLPYYCK